MTALALLGGFLAAAGLIGLGWCLSVALRVKRGTLSGEEARRAMAKVRAVNLAAVATAFLGLAALAVAAILG